MNSRFLIVAALVVALCVPTTGPGAREGRGRGPRHRARQRLARLHDVLRLVLEHLHRLALDLERLEPER